MALAVHPCIANDVCAACAASVLPLGGKKSHHPVIQRPVTDPEERLLEGDGPRPPSTLRLLLLAYWFPPAHGGGTPRPAKLCKYLSRRGWDIDVVTLRRDSPVDPALVPGLARVHGVRPLPLGPLLRALGRLEHATAKLWSRRLGNRTVASAEVGTPLYAAGFSEPDQGMAESKVEWVAPALVKSIRLIRRARHDVVCATMPPGMAGVAALAIQSLAGIPYVLDYRDSWTVDPNWTCDDLGRHRHDPFMRMRLGVGRAIERTMVRRAAAVVVVNRQVDRFRESFADVDPERFVFIPNAFDPEDFVPPVRTPPRGPSSPFRLVYLGHFYGIYNPYFFLRGLHHFVRRDKPRPGTFAVELIGHGFTDRMRRMAHEWGLDPYLFVEQARPYSESLRTMQEADALLVLQPPLAAFRDMVPTKVYEYLAVEPPVLAVVPDGATANLIRRYHAGLAVSPTEPDAIASALHKLLVERRPVRSGAAEKTAPLGYPYRADEFERTLRRAVLSSMSSVER